MPNIVEAVVAGDRPFFNGALFYPGEITTINLDDYQARDEDGEPTGKAPELGKGKLKNLAPVGDAPPVRPVEMAPIAPHAPNPVNPQGWPAGGKPSGSGRMVFPDDNGGSIEAVPAVGVESDENAAARREQIADAQGAAAKFDAAAEDAEPPAPSKAKK